jgi:hypothetical protein
MPQPVTGYGKAALARYLMRAELYPLERDADGAWEESNGIASNGARWGSSHTNIFWSI